MSTKRERLEKLVHDMQALADNCDAKGEFSAEDQERMVKMATDAKAMKDELLAEAEFTGAKDEAKSFLASLGARPEDDVSEEKKWADKARSEGLAQPDGVKTLGQLFAESPVYKDFIGRYANESTGVIPSSIKGIQSSPFAMAGFKDLVTGTSSTSAGAFVQNDRYGPLTDLIGERELTVRDLCTKGNTTSDTVEYVRVTTKTNNASPVVEASAPTGTSGEKPQSALAWEVVSTTVKTIAHWIPITKRAASDAGQVRTQIDNFLRYGLKEEEEDQILNGPGTGENFTGILQTSGINTVGSAGTDLDAIVDAIRVTRVTGRRNPNALVIHPNDWYSTNFLLAKDSATGQYLIADPRASVDQLQRLWGLQVVVSEAEPENTALVGEFRWAVIWDREQSTISVSDSHSDFFIRNLLAILAEERLAFGVLDPQAFTTVTAV